jgi:formate dehydrogenase subunit gamma
MAADTTPARIRRFTRTERTLHWLVALTFFTMLVTGLFLYFPGLAHYVDRPTAKRWHLWSAIAMLASFVLVPLLGNGRAVRESARAVQWSDADDVAWLRGSTRHMRGKLEAPPQGRFNAGQKLNTSISAALLVLLGITGTLLWLGERDTRWRFSGSVTVHDLSSIAIVVLVMGHVYLAVLNPSTRHAMHGMLGGDVDLEWARHHHAKWVDEVSGPEA